MLTSRLSFYLDVEWLKQQESQEKVYKLCDDLYSQYLDVAVIISVDSRQNRTV